MPPGGSKSWIQPATIRGRRRAIGLGGWPVVSLARDNSRSPNASRSRRGATRWPRSGGPACRRSARPRWRNVKTATNLAQQRERNAYKVVGDLPVDQIGREHVLRVLTPTMRRGSGLVFPSPRRPGRPLSDITLTKLLRYTGIEAVPNGFRSSFRTWASERTNADHVVMELCLAHQVVSAVERGYARSDLFDRRWRLMDQWAAFVTGGSAKVVRLHG